MMDGIGSVAVHGMTVQSIRWGWGEGGGGWEGLGTSVGLNRVGASG